MGKKPANMEKPSIQFQSKRKERIAYAIYSLGQMCLYVFLYMFLQLYLTDIGVSPAAVGVIFILARVWDAINDPLFGIIVDKCKLKTGKYLPWLRLSAFLTPILTAALFAIPADLSANEKTVLAGVLYTIWGMSYTICDVPYFSLVTAMSDNLIERNRIIANGRMLTSLGAMVVVVTVPLIYTDIGWMATGVIISAAGLITLLPLGFTVKERYRSGTKFPAIPMLALSVAKNKYLLIFCMAFILSGLTNAAGSIGSYFAIHCLGGPEMMSVMSLASIVPSMVSIALVPVLSKKIDKFFLYMGSLALTIIISIPMYFIGYQNVVLCMILIAVRTIVSTISSGSIMAMFILDCTEYGRYKSGVDATAVSVSLQTFTNKVYVAITGGIGMFILGFSGFVSGAEAVQPQRAIDMLWIMMSILPVIGQILSFILLLLGYKLRDRDVQLMVQVNNGQISKADAESLLSRAY
jgi:sugar (glycoside-pentoside-hexuronide) transporter